MAEALYRKYRSKSLDEVVGQRHITDTLAAALGSGKLSHAYLLTGPKGVGKTSVARILAHAVNDLPYTDESTHLDIIEIDAASNRRIDDIRDLREKVHIAPTAAPYKVYIIDEVHMLTGESFNALLKTLEEPPSHVIFILATTEAHKLPATIISRTQRFHFKPIDSESAVKHLEHIAKKEKIDVDPDVLQMLAIHGEGSFRDSIGLLDQLSTLTGGKITMETAEKLLGVAPLETIDTIIEHLKSGDTQSLQQVLSEQLDIRGVNVHTLTAQLIPALKQAAQESPDLYDLMDDLLEVPKSSHPSMKLTILLLRFASRNQPANAAKPTKAALASDKSLHTVSMTPRQVASNQPSVGIKNNKHAGTSDPIPKTEDSKQKTGDGPPFVLTAWPQVLAALKKTSPSLSSALAKAEPRLKADKLTLMFAYKLHQKKVDDPKYRSKLTQAIIDLGYECPNLTTVVDKSAMSPSGAPQTAPGGPPDETTRSVLDIMGGEVVDGREI